MNDRFKFRVWNNKHNRYIVDSHYPIGSDHIIVIRQDGKAYNLGLGDYEDYSNMHSWAVMEEFTDYIIEQCTGLKDKNGNLIFEGDRVGFYIYGQDEKWYGGEGTVIWYNSSWGIETSSRFICFENCIPMANPQGIEIIGNIHEQAEQKD